MHEFLWWSGESERETERERERTKEREREKEGERKRKRKRQSERARGKEPERKSQRKRERRRARNRAIEWERESGEEVNERESKKIEILKKERRTWFDVLLVRFPLVKWVGQPYIIPPNPTSAQNMCNAWERSHLKIEKFDEWESVDNCKHIFHIQLSQLLQSIKQHTKQEENKIFLNVHIRY